MKSLHLFVVLFMLAINPTCIAQNGFLTFSTTSNNTTANTGNTGFSGVRTGSGGGGWAVVNPGQEIGTQAELRGIASSSTSVNSVGIASTEYGTADQTFTVSWDMYLTGGGSGLWYFFAGTGATFAAAQSSAFSSSQVFAGLQFSYGASGTVTTNFRNSSGNWTSSGISGTPVSQDVAYTVTVVGNNSSSTVNYGASQSVATNTFDLWINGILVGNDLSKCQLGNTTDIDAFRFYGISSTGNVAAFYLDNIKWWNTCEAPSMSVFSSISSIPLNTYTDLFVNNGTASLAGNITVAKNLYYTSGTVNLNGNTLAYSSGATLTYTPASSAATTTNAVFPSANGPANLTINNSNGVNLHAARTVTGILTLTSGILNTASSNTITYGALSGGSSAAYVEGPQSFSTSSTSTVTFYCGKAGIYRSVDLTPSGSATTTWTIEYFRTDPNGVFGSSLASGINNISTQEYFQIDRSGTANATLSLSFEAGSLVSNLTDLRVVRWNGSQWADHGNGGTTGTTAAGTITTSAAVTSFSPFTFGSSAATNPLPVTLLYFNASRIINLGNRLTWATASEINNHYFEIERSKDMTYWEPVGIIPGNGNSNQIFHYEFIDLNAPEVEILYYRLAQVDNDGGATRSEVVTLNPSLKHSIRFDFTELNNKKISVINHQPETSIKINITGINGNKITEQVLSEIYNPLSLPLLPPGVYIISACNGLELITERFVVGQ